MVDLPNYLSMSEKHWKFAESISGEVKQEFPELDPLVLQLLVNRGVRSQEEIDVFLGPDWSRDTFDPFLFTRMREAVDRVFAAFAAGEVITVHGDYDADGVCGSAVIVSTLRQIARAMNFDEDRISSYIPHREKEGYGMSVSTIEHLNEHDKTKLVITVDCGISNKEAIDRGKELGIDTIVCDHHTMPEELPISAILIHPLVPGETYPNKYLCGTGVAFKLASALIIEARNRGAAFAEGHEKWLLDLVAIATVTDVMELQGENRVLETFGLLVLNKTKRAGLKKLVEIAGGKWGALDTVSIGFVIGPRLNAAGRMSHANEALNLLLEEDEGTAAMLAEKLNQTNLDRRSVSDAMYKEALGQLGEIGDDALLVVTHDSWSPGIVGLVAGKILSDFGRPVFAIGRHGETYVGSGRSPDGFDITGALRRASEFLEKFGGHPQACGFSVSSENLEAAIECMKTYAAEHAAEDMLQPTLYIDAEISLDDISWDLVEAVRSFAPFGRGNPQPLFAIRGAEVMQIDTVGKDGSHLKLTVRSERGKIWQMIGFRFGLHAERLSVGSRIDVVAELGENRWNGRRDVQIKIEDLKY